MSPRNLLRSGLAEWVVQANPAAKVVSVAGKDRAAILMAAHARGDIDNSSLAPQDRLELTW